MEHKIITYRQAFWEDWDAVGALIHANSDTLAQENLPRLDEFFVAILSLDGDPFGEMIGCCALVAPYQSKRMAEIRSLAVKSSHKKNGVGRELVMLCEKRARELGIGELLAITKTEEFFQSLGFNTFRGGKLAMLKPLPKKPAE